MRISKEPAERKQEIIDTAMRLFYEKGYEKTSISDIAKAMNVAQGLFYRYFPSKEVLFDTAVEQYAQLQADQMTAFLKTSQQKKAANVDTDVDETASADERMPAGEAMPVDETASAGGMTLIDIVKQMPNFYRSGAGKQLYEKSVSRTGLERDSHETVLKYLLQNEAGSPEASR